MTSAPEMYSTERLLANAQQIADVLTTVDWPLTMSDGSDRDDRSFRRKQDDLSFLGGL